jgi:hypothetical protein
MHLESRIFLHMEALERSGVRFISTGATLQTWVPLNVPDAPIRVFAAAYRSIILDQLRTRDAALCAAQGLSIERLYYAREARRRGLFSEAR